MDLMPQTAAAVYFNVTEGRPLGWSHLSTFQISMSNPLMVSFPSFLSHVQIHFNICTLSLLQQ